MAPTAEDVVIRQAFREDFEAVLSIGEMYGGRDYLKAIYLPLIENKDTYAVVATIQDVVVGFSMTTTFDGGLTVMRRASRVNEKFKGLGVYHRMKEELQKHTRECRPNVEYETMANTNNEDHLADGFFQDGFHLHYRKAVFPVMVRPPYLLCSTDSSATEPAQVVDVKQLTHQDLSLLFQSEERTPRVFPRRRLFNFFLGYRLMDANIQNILCDGGGGFFSLRKRLGSPHEGLPANGGGQNRNHLENSLNQTPCNEFLQGGTNCNHHSQLDSHSVRQVAMVTFFYCYRTLTGFHYFLDIYSEPDVSCDHLREHLRHNLLNLQGVFPGEDGMLTSAFDLHIPMDLIKTSLDGFGVRDILSGQEEFQVLYERVRGNE